MLSSSRMKLSGRIIKKGAVGKQDTSMKIKDFRFPEVALNMRKKKSAELSKSGFVPLEADCEVEPVVISAMEAPRVEDAAEVAVGASNEPAAAPADEIVSQDKSQAFEDGREAGVQAGMQLEQEKITPLIESFESMLKDLTGMREEITKQSERHIVDLALEISQKIIKHEISMNQEVVIDMVRDALKSFVDQDEVKILVGEKEYEAFLAMKPTLMEDLKGVENLVIEVDEAITDGGCMIESDIGAVDLRVRNQLDEIRKSLGFSHAEEA